MARPLRIEYPGAFYHVKNRGNAGESIFQTPGDGNKFLAYLAAAAGRFSLRIHAYCLLPNRYHLLLETPKPNLSQAVQWINVSYAVYYNRTYGRTGHLFGGRFKAFLLEPDTWLIPISRYIHLDPVRAGIVRDPSCYRWSSYPALVGGSGRPEWLETGRLFAGFGKGGKTTLQKYREYVEETDPEAVENPAREASNGLILGPPDFIARIRNRLLTKRPFGGKTAQPGRPLSAVDVEAVIGAVCRHYGCNRESVVKRGKKRNLPRDVAIFLSRGLTGETGKKLGETFGNVSGANITMRCRSILKAMDRKRELRDGIETLKRLITENEFDENIKLRNMSI